MLALILAVVVGFVPTLTPQVQHHELTRAERAAECRYRSRDGHPGWTPTEVKLTIRCAAQKYPVDIDKAMFIANRESGFDPTATNPYSGACGIYQHIPRYWPGRVDAYRESHHGMERTFRRCYNARSNVLTSIWMAHVHGWGPWGG